MLAQQELLPYLLDRGLVTRQSVVEGDLAIEDASRHNRNYTVMRDRAPSYLVKQGGHAAGFATVSYEAAVLQCLARLDGQPLTRMLPRSVLYDRESDLLILELLRDAQDLRAYHNRRGRFPRSLAARVGGFLGTLHALPLPAGMDGEGFTLSRRVPPVLSLHQPPLALIQTVSGGNLRLIALIHRFPALCASIAAARAGWQATSLIHGDARWDNVLVTRPDGGRGRSTVRLIDWESASIGDPCWDAGSFLSEYLAHWLGSIPSVGDVPPGQLVALARVPLERVQPAMHAFWRAYTRRLGLTGDEERAWRRRAVRYAGIRLIDRACEQMDAASRLTGMTYHLLQTSLNIMQRPDAAAIELLGIASEHGETA